MRTKLYTLCLALLSGMGMINAEIVKIGDLHYNLEV